MRYKFFNIHTNHIFHQSDNLQSVLTMYHKVPRRKCTDLVILDTETGEILRLKQSRASAT